MYTEITDDSLADIVKNNPKVMVQYSASWCGNCKIMKPKFKRFSRELEDVEFVMVDAEKFPNSRKLAQVTNLPTLRIFIKASSKTRYKPTKETD
jgi:thiol-disulfide isomerase/thioredoxin